MIRNISIAKQPLSTPPSFPLHCRIASKLRILVVDDMASMRFVLVRALHLWLPSGPLISLKQFTPDIVCASDGIEALSLLGIPHPTGALNAAVSDSTFDVCICDDDMPNMSGLELVAKVRMNGCKIPINGFSAKPFPDAVENFLRAGADAVLLKPIRVDNLLCTICDRLGLSS